MQNNLPVGTIIGFSSHFDYKRLGDWKHLITKPLHYGIQWGTQSPLHHVGIIPYGQFYDEAMGKYGVRRITLEQKISEVDDCVEIRAYKPRIEFTKAMEEFMLLDLNSQLGKEYSTIEAFLSIFTAILPMQTKLRTKEQFCSKLDLYAYRNLTNSVLMLDNKNLISFYKCLNYIMPRTINPEELIKKLQAFRLIEPYYEIVKEAYG